LAAVVGALALASPLAISAAPAAALGIQFSTVSGDGSGDLTITVTSDFALTDWTLSLSNGTSTYAMDDFADFTDQSAPFTAGQPQTYVLTNAQKDLGSIALPPGSYTVTATAATDSNNDTLPAAKVMTGAFNYLAQPTLALSSPNFNTTQPNQAVIIKGQITGCTTLACPSSWSNTAVTVTDVTASGNPLWTSTSTDSAGNFSVSGVTGVPGDSYSASVPAVPGTSLAATAPSNTLDVAQYTQTSITATATPAPYGRQSIKGQLTYQSNLQQVGAGPGVSVTATAGSHKLSTTTGANGDFSLTLPAITGTTTWLLSTQNDLTSSPFLAGTQYSVGATQLWPVKITGFTASIDKFGFVHVAGCMATTISPPPPPEFPEIQIQWRSHRPGPWKLLGSVDTTRRDGCAGVGFVGQGPAPAASAYYRANFPPGDAIYASATSPSTGRVWIYPTQFNPFRASSPSVAAGRKVTISGTLQFQAGSKWRGLGSQRVVIIFSRNGKNNWFLLPNGSVKTNSKGAFSVTFNDYASEYWSANYGGNKTHLVVSAPLIRVKVHGHASNASGSSLFLPLGLKPTSRFGDPFLTPAGWVARPYLVSTDPWLTLMGD
jgi:hypothetical protein